MLGAHTERERCLEIDHQQHAFTGLYERVARRSQKYPRRPEVFGKFYPDRGSAMAFAATKKAPVVFLR